MRWFNALRKNISSYTIIVDQSRWVFVFLEVSTRLLCWVADLVLKVIFLLWQRLIHLTLIFFGKAPS